MSDPYAAALGVSVAPKFDSSSSYGTPSDLLDRLKQTESSGDNYAVHKTTKAMGPYQFEPDTVAYLHKRGVKFDPFDEQQARAAADWYLQDLKAKNGGDLNKAVASYGGFVSKDPSGYQSKVLGGQQSANDPYAAALGVSDSQSAQKPVQVAAPSTQQVGGGRGITPASAYSNVSPTSPIATSPINKVAQSDPNYNPIRDGKVADPLKLVAHAVTGLGSSAYGGLKGLATLATGGSMDDAANAVRSTQEKYTYNSDPNSESGQIEQQFDSKYNPLYWPGVVGSYAGEKLADAGYPGLGAATNAGVTVFGGPAVVKGIKAASSTLGDIIKPAADIQTAPRVEPTMSAPKPRYKMVDGQWRQVTDNPSPSVANPQPQAPSTYKPTLEQASPELQQTVAKAKAKGLSINNEALARHVEAETLPVPVKLSEGQALMDPATISDEMNARGGKSPRVSPDFYNQQGKALAQNLDVIRSNVAPDVAAVDPTQHGQVLVDSYKSMDAAKQADISSKYQALRDANGGDLAFDGKTFAENAQQALNKAYKSRFLPSELAGELEDIANGRQMNYQQFEEMRTTLANAARKAERSGDGNAASAISLVRNSLENTPIIGEAGNIKALADQARAAARARFKAIESDPAYKAAVNDDVAHGEASPLADDFVRKYIIGGKRANLMQMRQNLDNDTVAQQTIPAATVDFLKKQAKADIESGRFNAATYNGTIDSLRPKFDVVLDPKTAQQVQQVGNVAKYTTIQPKGSYVNNSNTLVGAASDVGKDLLKGYLNVKTMGASGVAEKMAQTVKANKAAKASVAPGAGVTKLSDLGRTSPP